MSRGGYSFLAHLSTPFYFFIGVGGVHVDACVCVYACYLNEITPTALCRPIFRMASGGVMWKECAYVCMYAVFGCLRLFLGHDFACFTGVAAAVGQVGESSVFT